MTSKKTLTKNEVAEIQRLISEGLGDGEIAKRVGRHRSTVHRLRQNGYSRSTTSSGRMLHIRISDEEHRAFQERVEALGMSKSEAGRRLLRHSLGVLDLRVEEIEAVHALRMELNAIGRNLNQLTQLANAGRLRWNARDAKLVESVDLKAERVVTTVAALVTAARSRSFVDADFSVTGHGDD